MLVCVCVRSVRFEKKRELHSNKSASFNVNEKKKRIIENEIIWAFFALDIAICSHAYIHQSSP